ncbi:MAG: InlB B-repeat-containing protein [Oscillospiraceae bacterium]|nr:InlB B-repeat-containing protein [Oscillospiraceae bacterium]
MKKTLRRSLSVLLAIAMLASMLAIGATASPTAITPNTADVITALAPPSVALQVPETLWLQPNMTNVATMAGRQTAVREWTNSNFGAGAYDGSVAHTEAFARVRFQTTAPDRVTNITINTQMYNLGGRSGGTGGLAGFTQTYTNRVNNPTHLDREFRLTGGHITAPGLYSRSYDLLRWTVSFYLDGVSGHTIQAYSVVWGQSLMAGGASVGGWNGANRSRTTFAAIGLHTTASGHPGAEAGFTGAAAGQHLVPHRHTNHLPFDWLRGIPSDSGIAYTQGQFTHPVTGVTSTVASGTSGGPFLAGAHLYPDLGGRLYGNIGDKNNSGQIVAGNLNTHWGSITVNTRFQAPAAVGLSSRGERFTPVGNLANAQAAHAIPDLVIGFMQSRVHGGDARVILAHTDGDAPALANRYAYFGAAATNSQSAHFRWGASNDNNQAPNSVALTPGASNNTTHHLSVNATRNNFQFAGWSRGLNVNTLSRMAGHFTINWRDTAAYRQASSSYWWNYWQSIDNFVRPAYNNDNYGRLRNNTLRLGVPHTNFAGWSVEFGGAARRTARNYRSLVGSVRVEHVYHPTGALLNDHVQYADGPGAGYAWTRLDNLRTGDRVRVNPLEIPGMRLHAMVIRSYPGDAWLQTVYADADGNLPIDYWQTHITAGRMVRFHYVQVPVRITLNPQSGTVTPTFVDRVQGADHDLPTPTRTGFGFQGWWTTPATGGEQRLNTTPVTNMTNHTLYARWLGNLYNLNFNAGGGSVTPADRPSRFGDEFGTLPAPTPPYGHSFGNWRIGSTTGEVAAATTVHDVDGDITLFAHYTANVHRLYTNLDYGTHANVFVREVTFGQVFGALGTPTRVGYTFSDWRTSGGALITETDTLAVNSNVTLYARWVPRTDTEWRMHVYTQNVNGTFTRTQDALRTGTTGAAITPAGHYTVPDAARYVFDNTHTDNVVTGNIAANGSSVLRVHYARRTFPLTLDLAGGTGLTAPANELRWGYVHDLGAEPTRYGHTFTGWNITPTDASATMTTITMGTAATHAIAQWQANTHRLMTHLNDGEHDYVDAGAITFGQAVGSVMPADPSRAGWDFVEWRTDDGYVVDDAFVLAHNGNLEIYAIWVPRTDTNWAIHVYRQDASGNFTLQNVSDRIGETASAVSAAGNYVSPNADWYVLDPDHANHAPSGFIAGDGSTVLRVHYARRTFTLTIDLAGGTGVDVLSVTQAWGTQYVIPQTPTRVGFTFSHWTVTGENASLSGTNTVVMGTAATTATAVWTPRSFTVAFDANSGLPAMQNTTVTFGGNMVLPAQPLRTGYTFAGWHTVSTATGGDEITTATPVNATTIDAAILPPAAANTFYARWTPNTNTAWAVRIYTQNADGSFSYAGTAPQTGTTGAAIAIADATYTSPNAARYAFDDDHALNVLSGNIAADGSTVLRVHYVRNTVTLTVDMAGGTGVGSPSDAMRWGSQYTLTGTPQRYGFTFDRWEITTGQTEGAIVVGNVVTVGRINTVVTARWTANLHRLYTNVNHGDATDAFLRSVAFGQAYDVLPALTRAGYIFDGWFTASVGGDEVTVATTLTVNGNVTVYAQWTARDDTPWNLRIYTQNADGSFSHAGTVPQTGTTGAAVAVADATYTSPDAALFAFDDDHAGNVLSGNIAANGSTVLAVYYARNTFTLTVDLDGGTGVVSPSDPLRWGQIHALAGTPTKTGYTFSGWQITVGQNDGASVVGSTVTMGAVDTTVTANWIPNQFRLYTSLNYSTHLPAFLRTVTFGQVFGALPTVTRLGYVFDTWHNAGGDVVDATTIWDAAADQTLYAQWNPDTFILVFDPTGGTIVGATQFDVLLGDDVPEPNLQLRTDFVFGGWFTAPNGDGVLVTPGEPLTLTMLSELSQQNPAIPTTLYALWLYEGQYIVQFVLGGGNIAGSTADVTEQVYIDDTLPVPTGVLRTGHSLQGWNTQEDGLGDWVTASTEVTATLLSEATLEDPAVPTQFFAIWQANEYRVQFELSDGSYEAFTVTFGETFTLPAALSRVGYDFTGWFTAAEGGTQITATTIVDHINIDPAIVYPGIAATFMARFTPRNDTAWTVHVILENADGTFADPIVTNFIGGTTGVLVEAFPSFFDDANYVFDADYAGNVLSSNIAADGSTVLVLRYLRRTFTLTVDLDGGTGVVGPTETLRWGEQFDLGGSPTRTGFEFAGWQINGAGTTLAGNVVTMGTANATLTAQWTETPFRIELVADGATYGTHGYVTLGTTVGELPAPANIGPNWHFVGWSQDGISMLQPTSVLQNTDPFVAQFVRIYTVLFDATGGSITGEGTPTTTRSATYTHNFAVPAATRANHVFLHWYVNLGGNSIIVSNATEVWALNSAPRNPAAISAAAMPFADGADGSYLTVFAAWEEVDGNDGINWGRILTIVLGIMFGIAVPLLMFAGGRLAGTLFCWYLENCA